MRSWLIVSFLVMTCPFAGCLAGEDEFVWPEPDNWDCSIEPSYNLSCSVYLEGLSSPIFSLNHPEDDELWIVELSGRISSWNGEVTSEVADLGTIVSDCHVEQGLLGMAFAQSSNSSHSVLLSYIEEGSCDGPNDSDLLLSSASISSDGTIDMGSITTLKTVEQPFRNHNGGHLLNIGDNEYLWGLGDGGSGYDPDGNGQDPYTELGSILYFSFTDGEVNPVLQDGVGDPFVLHYGLRNPWRFDLDSEDRLWIADVGQSCWEEINLVSMDIQANLGWADMEGSKPMSGDPCNTEYANYTVDEEYTIPVASYPHTGGNCSITGGFWMDWGPEDLRDGYLYGDFCSGSIWILKEENGGWMQNYVGSSGGMIVGFGQGLNDELLAFHWTGEIVQIG